MVWGYYTSSSKGRSVLKSIDWSLVFCYIAIVLIGWVTIYASQSIEPTGIFDSATRSGKQFVWMMISFGFDLVLLFVLNPKLWEVIAPFIYIFVLVLLVAVIFLSKDVNGARTWFEFGSFKFQPAEVSKITTSLMLAMIMGRSGFKLSKNVPLILLILGLPTLAILAEKETGTVLVYVGYIFVLYREGLSGWWLFALALLIALFIMTIVTSWWLTLAALAVVCTLCYFISVRSMATSRLRRKVLKFCLAGFFAGAIVIFASDFIMNKVLGDHQRTRIEVLLGVKDDPSGAGYNVRQSMIAIGSGGFSGKGFLQSTQTSYGFVPEQSTDFIFCTLAEEQGFLGCIVLIGLYIFLIYRIFVNADCCRSAFARIYGFCLASCLFMHLFINIGMTVGLVPVIGIPLPMVSYGGSSLLAFSVMIFIFLALFKQENKYF